MPNSYKMQLIANFSNEYKNKFVLSTGVFRQKVTHHNGYLLDINLSEIPDGRYIMRVRQANGQKTAQVILKYEGQLMLSHLTRIK